MILTVNKTNTIPANVGIPYGNIKDDDGTFNGTPIDSELLADYVQFFERMFNESGITANNLPDNEDNDFQLYEAFQQMTTPFQVYTALISQPGTSAPTPSVLHQRMNTVISIARLSAGRFTINSSNPVFIDGKTWVSINGDKEDHTYTVERNSNTQLAFYVNDGSGTRVDSALDNTSFEVRVYS